jgi:hypothetical protein
MRRSPVKAIWVGLRGRSPDHNERPTTHHQAAALGGWSEGLGRLRPPTPTTLTNSPQWGCRAPYHCRVPKPVPASRNRPSPNAPLSFTTSSKLHPLPTPSHRAPTAYACGNGGPLPGSCRVWSRLPGKNAQARAVAVCAPGLGSKTPGTGTIGRAQTWGGKDRAGLFGQRQEIC